MKEVTIEEVNDVFIKASKDDKYKGVLAVTREPLVSSDFIGNVNSCIVDLSLTNVVGQTMVKVVAWYDNEAGYSHRLVEMAEKFA
jgi:glyceraldehyde 3-phosphate dehydrogenase